MGHFRVAFSLRIKTVFVRNHSYENVFRLKVHFQANQTHFHVKGFTQGLGLKQRHKVSRKWAVILLLYYGGY